MWMLWIGAAFALGEASHRGHLVGDEVVWESEYRHPDAVVWINPMPRGTHVTGAEPVLNADRQIIGLRGVQRGVQFRTPANDERITPPLVTEPVLQRVVVEGVRFVPSSAVGAEHHLRHYSQPGIDREQRRALDRWADGRQEPARSQPVYLIADDRVANGIPGTIRPRNQVGIGVMLALGGLFAGLLGGLTMLYRALGSLAKKEQNDLYIERELNL